MAEKELEKNSGLNKNERLTFAMTADATVITLFIYLLTKANQANWRAGHCEFVMYLMVEMKQTEMNENESYLI